MIQLKEISKSYTTGEFTQKALDKVDLNFRKNEFVAILGPSGSGKTTFLNVIGGLDNYDSGDLIINGQSTKNFKDKDWDAYRNNSVGFVFQSYNLIPHLSVRANVEMGMTLSGVSKRERRKKSEEVLEKVGLREHMHKKPNQLSGGQMQRVAIARALSNDPDIILADEPTGALDSETSIQIMDLIKEISKDKLVIMVTHNAELAEEYSDRIVNFLDGQVISDTSPVKEEDLDQAYDLKSISMSFFTALKLSGMNILAKKWRTLLTAFASSIGIIGIALILSLSNGFDKEISDFESNTLSGFPISISRIAEEFDMDAMKEQREKAMGKENEDIFPKDKKVEAFDPAESMKSHKNKITGEFLEYIEDIDEDIVAGYSYKRLLDINLLNKKNNKALELDSSIVNFTSYPEPKGGGVDYLEENYDLLEGRLPENKEDLLLIVDKYNRIPEDLIKELGFEESKGIDFSNIIGKKLKSVPNNDYYKKIGDLYTVNGDRSDLSEMYENENNIELEIVGIIRIKEDKELEPLATGIALSDSLYLDFIEDAKNSDIVKDQRDLDYNILTGEEFQEEEGAGRQIILKNKDLFLSRLGANEIPHSIEIYPRDFDSKEKVLDYIGEWNKGKSEEDTIVYTDLAEIMTSLSGDIMGAITLVLIAFASISLVVSLIMIGIITYISVLERTKEIGVLRSLGARKKDITRVFNAETFIIGLSSGALAIGISYGLIGPLNRVLEDMTGLENIAKLNPLHSIILVMISLFLTVLGGAIPAIMAAKQDPVDALRE